MAAILDFFAHFEIFLANTIFLKYMLWTTFEPVVEPRSAVIIAVLGKVLEIHT